jgi:Leucine-rich repeat (LRR) protein
LDRNKISKIDYLSTLKQLEHLSLEQNNLIDISVIGQFANLKFLNLNANQIHNIDLIEHLDQLNWLNLSGNNISDLTPILNSEGMKEGSVLHLVNCPLSETAINEQIPELKNRGVYVEYSLPYP